jgi:hypothetical protein
MNKPESSLEEFENCLKLKHYATIYFILMNLSFLLKKPCLAGWGNYCPTFNKILLVTLFYYKLI